jgi:hypothetical protein
LNKVRLTQANIYKDAQNYQGAQGRGKIIHFEDSVRARRNIFRDETKYRVSTKARNEKLLRKSEFSNLPFRIVRKGREKMKRKEKK